MSTNEIKFGQSNDESLVDKDRVSCDGGQNGHPKIYLSVDVNEIIVCPYCSHKFLKTNKKIKINEQ